MPGRGPCSLELVCDRGSDTASTLFLFSVGFAVIWGRDTDGMGQGGRSALIREQLASNTVQQIELGDCLDGGERNGD